MIIISSLSAFILNSQPGKMLARSLFLCFLLAFSLNHVQASLGGKINCGQNFNIILNLFFSQIKNCDIWCQSASTIPHHRHWGSGHPSKLLRRWNFMETRPKPAKLTGLSGQNTILGCSQLKKWKTNLEPWKNMKTDLEPWKTTLNHERPTLNHEKP